MKSRLGRLAVLALGTLAVFGASVVILLRLIPVPRRDVDYLVIGTLATFAALAALFVALITSVMKDPTAFTKRKKG